jgi:hypothetical protein
MTDTLFSSFLMVDRSPSPIAGRGAPATANRQARAPGSEQHTRELFVIAFLRALKEAAPEEAALAIGASARATEDLAAAAADVALGRSVILQLKPDLAEGQRSAVRAFLETVVRVSGTLDESRLEAAIGKLAEVLLPDELADARGALASDNLELRDRFIGQVSQLTSAEVGAQAGLRTKNPYATAARWKKAGDILSVQHRGKEYFPTFQFREGRPHPTIKKALAALPPRLSPWQRAFWFVSTNGWLGDKAPADMLDEQEAVIAAAEREGEEVVG